MYVLSIDIFKEMARLLVCSRYATSIYYYLKVFVVVHVPKLFYRLRNDKKL